MLSPVVTARPVALDRGTAGQNASSVVHRVEGRRGVLIACDGWVLHTAGHRRLPTLPAFVVGILTHFIGDEYHNLSTFKGGRVLAGIYNGAWRGLQPEANMPTTVYCCLKSSQGLEDAHFR